MSTNNNCTTNSHVFQKFLMLLGNVVHSDLKRQIEFLRVENQILRSRCPKRIIATASERRRLIKFGLPLNGSIKKIISIVSYSTFRRWVNGYPDNQITTNKVGRPRTTPEEVRALIVRLARENKWGYTRILGELKKLRIKSVSRNTVKNILIENGIDPLPKRGEDSWDEFIKRHFKTLWACDFFTKTVWTALGPKTFHALFFINIHTRKVKIAGITKNPTKEWVNKQAKSVSFLFETKETTEKLLVRDGDKKYSKEFDEIFRQLGVDVKKIPYKSPNLNPYAEGWVGTIKRDCLNHFIVFGEQHFRYLVKEYAKYYNTVRPHSGLDNKPIQWKDKKKNGKVKRKSQLGGLLNHYYRE